MPMRRTIPLCPALLVVLVFVVFLTPATAAARSQLLDLGPLRASHGYKASVMAFRGSVGLTVARKRNGREYRAQYSVKGTVTEEGLEARFGDLGSISMKFVPLRPGGSRGTFEGTIQFRGEGGYVELQASRAKGSYITLSPRPAPPIAAAPPASVNPDPVYALLDAWSPRAGMRALASHPDERGLPGFYASAGESYDRVGIVRSVSVPGPTGSFTFDNDLRTATLRPPAPFSGSATFTRKAGGRGRWLGNLVVDLPGRADVPMTGPEFRAGLSHELPS